MRGFWVISLLLLAGCGSYENDKIDVDSAKNNNPLLVPPCLNNG
jgi:hypothetical protein